MCDFPENIMSVCWMVDPFELACLRVITIEKVGRLHFPVKSYHKISRSCDRRSIGEWGGVVKG